MTDDINYKLGCIASSLKSIETNVADIKDAFREQETRIRSLEQTRSTQYGALAIVSALFGVIGSVVVRVFFK